MLYSLKYEYKYICKCITTNSTLSLHFICSMDYTSLGCCTLAFVLYLNTLNAGFVYDDR